MVTIVDYQMGNLHSVSKACEFLGNEVKVSSAAEDIRMADKLILPGVGSFGLAMEELISRGLDCAIRDFIATGKPFLGICLGMQLLMEGSAESPGISGLGLIKGGVSKFKSSPDCKVPHMGWNQLEKIQPSCKMLVDVQDGAFVYFVHSYFVVPIDASVTAATSQHGGAFTAVLMKDNIFATQFHPEKSQQVGLRILKNFLEI